MPLPDARPSEKIARLFPQTDPAKNPPAAVEPAKTATPAAATPPTATALPAQAAIAKPVPLPEARPNIKPAVEPRRYRRVRYYGRYR
jgi:membrane-bound lytic murein transglycosylase A